MAKTLQYWGTGNFQEHPYTGRIVTWTEKEKQTVDDAIATKLLASGAGFVLDNDETGEVVTSRIDPVTGGIASFNGVVFSCGSVAVSPSGDTSGVTDTAAIRSAISTAVASVKAKSGSILNVALNAGIYYINDTISINDGIVEDYPTPSTATMTIPPSFYGAGKGKTYVNMVTAAKPAFLINCKTASTHLSNWKFSDLSLIGPGGSDAETVGLQVGGVNASATEDFQIVDIEFKAFVVGLRFENVCNGTISRTLFGAYTRGVEFGYNADTLLFEECRFGDENDASKTGTALSYTYHSALNPSGGSINAHTFKSCWFMRQVNCADIQDSTSGVVFDNCYYERCTQYAKIGKAASATGQRGVFWQYCHFSQPYDATDTMAKIEVQHSSDDSTIGLIRCRTDDGSGAYIAWVKVGADTSLTWLQNILPATNQVISYSGRSIALDTYKQMHLNQRLWTVADHSLGGSPLNQHEVYNPSYSTGSETQISRWANINKSTGSVNSSASIITLASDSICWSGLVRSRRTAALPTASAQWNGVIVTLQGGAGVADQLYVCLKSSADTYSWKSIITG